MKKTYMAPSAEAIHLIVEGMMAASGDKSINYQSDESVTDINNVLSNAKGWDSTAWSADED